MSPDLDRARKLLELAEREVNPERKFMALEEGVNILNEYAYDQSVSNQERDYALNLRRSNVRRLLNQLIEMPSIELIEWFRFSHLLMVRLEIDVKAVLEEDTSLKKKLGWFINLWEDQLKKYAKAVKS